MFLIERIIGIGAYCAALFLFCGYLAINDKAKLSNVLRAYLLVLVLLAFFYYPDVTMDLYRLRIEINSWMNYSTIRILEVAMNSSTPGWYIYGYFLGKSGIDGLLPAVTALIVYRNIFKVICRSCNKFNIKNREAAKIAFCFMSVGSVFVTTISNIRTMLGMSIVLVCVYEELVEGKNVFKNIWKYIIAASFHQVVLTVILVRFGYLLFEKNIKKRNVVFIKFLRVGGVALLLGGLLMFGSGILESVQNKALSYLSGDTYSYVWEYVIGWINLVAIVISLIQAQKIQKKNKSNEIKNVSRLLLLYLIPTIVFAYEYSIFRRYEIFCSMLWCVILSYNLLNKSKQISVMVSPRFRFKYVDIMMAIGFVNLLISCTRGDLCGYKFFLR